MELLVVVSIALILLAVTLQGLVSLRRERVLDESVVRVVTLVGEARSLTLFSKNATEYGVHFTTSDVTRFTGATYSSENPDNVVTALPLHATISSIMLEGGGSDIVFDRLTGETDAFGTITLELSADPTRTRTITVSHVGLVEVQ